MDNTNYSILIIEDEKADSESLQKWFLKDGYRVDVAETWVDALKNIQKQNYDLAFIDTKIEGIEGVELLRRIKVIDHSLTIVIITASASVKTAVQFLKEGAHDYLIKPIDPDELIQLVKNLLNPKRNIKKNIPSKEKIDELKLFYEIIGKSLQMKKVLDLISLVSNTNTPVLIRGESGTGKKLVARIIHANSMRKFFPIITVNCSLANDLLLRSELFGHEKGTFPGALQRRKGKLEMANNGTIFFDELADLSEQLQIEILNVLETHQFTRLGGGQPIDVDLRFICATNKDLESAVRERKLNKDLYYQLSVFSIFLPPLRERNSDIPLLCQHFLKRFARSMNKTITEIDPEAQKLLMLYDWPGNVKELENTIERATIVCKSQTIKKEDLPSQISLTHDFRHRSDSLKEMEKMHIQKVLNQCNWNISKTAEILEIDRATLYNKISKYKLR